MSKNSKQTRVNDFLSSPIFVALVTFMALVLAVFFDWLQGVASFSSIFLGGMIAFLVVLFGILITSLINRLKQQEEFEDKILDLQNIIITSGMSWLVNDRYLSSLERDSKETWIFTNFLEKDINEESEFHQVIKENLEKGNKYKYFLPKTSSVIASIGAYNNIYNYAEGQVAFHLISADEHNFYTDIVIYNINTSRQTAVEWLPNDEYDFHIELDQQHTNRVIGIGRLLEQKHPEFHMDNRTEPSEPKTKSPSS